MKNRFWLMGIAVVLAMSGSEGFAIGPDSVVTTIAGQKMTAGSSDGAGTAARFSLTTGITTDGSNLYLVDTSNHTIRKFDISNGEVSTLAGAAGVSGSTDGTGAAARFNYPQGITSDGTNLYVADTKNYTIRKIVVSTGEVSTLAGKAVTFGSIDGTGSVARFGAPHGITTDGSNLYVADTWNGVIRKIVISTREVSTLAGKAGDFGATDGSGAVARFGYAISITTDGSNLYVVDNGNNTIRKIIISNGEVTTLAGTAMVVGSADGMGPAASFCNSQTLTTDGTNLYVADTANLSIRKINIITGVVSTLIGVAGAPDSIDGYGTIARFSAPHGITTDGINLYVTDNGAIRKIQ